MISILVALSLTIAHAVSESFCGQIDFTKANNQDLENILFFDDAGKNRKVDRSQCGLPGESLSICSSCSGQTTEEMMRVVRPMVGAADHLNWHFQWHSLRTQEFRMNREGKNGEDFLFMHRLMIKMVQLELASAGLPCIASWQKIPRADDSVWPIPRKLEKDEMVRVKDQIDRLNIHLNKVKSAAFLQKITLDRLGNIIERGVHQELHNLYRGNPLCSAEAKLQGYCDDLLPPESSPVNKHFWKIHGMVDDLIGAWLNANGYKSISKNCQDEQGCYQWQGTWVGEYPKNP